MSGLNNNKNNSILHFDAIFSYATIGIVVTDSAGKINAINPFALKEFGYTEKELIGKEIEILMPARFRANHSQYHRKYIGKALSRQMGTGLCLIAINKTGKEFPVEISFSNYKRSGGDYVISFIVDVSKRDKSERAIKKLKDELEVTVEQRTRDLNETMQQLETALEKEKELSELKSRFVSMASHEFRTPLSTVLSSAYLIEKYTTVDDQPKREKHLQRIISSVNLLTETLNDFLNVGKIEEGKIQVRYTEFNIRELVNSVIEEINATLKKGQKINYKNIGDEEVLLDRSLLKHIIMNLLSNASKFSSESGPINIKTTCRDQHIKLSIKDMGIGISKEDQKHLMERFFRGSNAGNIQGTGLGLHIVSKYAELMNAVVICKTELEKGTEFIISFDPKKN